MKHLNVANYTVTIQRANEQGIAEAITVPYQVRDSLCNILFSQKQIRARQLLARDDLARKILGCETDTIALEDAEFAQLLEAVEALEGYGQNDIELVRRVMTASA